MTETVTIKVKPAELTVSVKASSMYYTGEEQIASIIASGQSVDSTPVTFTYSDKEDGNYTSGVACCVATLPTPVCAFADVAIAVGAFLCHEHRSFLW